MQQSRAIKDAHNDIRALHNYAHDVPSLAGAGDNNRIHTPQTRDTTRVQNRIKTCLSSLAGAHERALVAVTAIAKVHAKPHTVAHHVP